MGERTQWWLASLDRYGNAKQLEDGPHSGREGVENALYLFGQLGLSKGRTFACAEVRLTDVEPLATTPDTGGSHEE